MGSPIQKILCELALTLIKPLNVKLMPPSHVTLEVTKLLYETFVKCFVSKIKIYNGLFEHPVYIYSVWVCVCVLYMRARACVYNK